MESTVAPLWKELLSGVMRATSAPRAFSFSWSSLAWELVRVTMPKALYLPWWKASTRRQISTSSSPSVENSSSSGAGP